jgi:hypothetical protein
MAATKSPGQKPQSLSACIVQLLKSEPSRCFLPKDLVDRIKRKPGSIRQTLCRLSRTGKGGGPVRRVAHGMYQYAPEKEHENLLWLMRSGNWKIENLVFVAKGAYPPLQSHNEMMDGPPHSNLPKHCPGYPEHLPTGQQILWERYNNGTEVIRLSAKGAPPFSPDHVLTLIYLLKTRGFEPDKWHCTSFELNIDSRKIRMDACYSIEVIKGLLLKAYQHGYNGRIELAYRCQVPLKEVMELFHLIVNGFYDREATMKVKQFDERLRRCEKTMRLTYNIAVKSRDDVSQQLVRKQRPQI